MRGVGVTESWIRAARHRLDESDIMADIVRTGKTEVIRGWDPRFDRANFESEQHAGLVRIFAPLAARDRTIGLLEAGRKAESAGLITEDERRAVRILAQQAGLAIHNARLFEAIKLSESQLRAALMDLRIAEDELRRRERLATLGQLSGGIAHELRNPLAIIRNSTYLLAMALKNADEKTARHLATIDRQVESANKIINDLLDLARSKQPDRRAIETATVIHEAIASAAMPSNVRVELNLPSDLPPVLFDPTQLRQVLINLITNAYQAMPDGGELFVTSELNHDHILVRVRDTGVGIPEENLDRIFLPLYSTKSKGIGLGLALAKQLAEVNEAELTVTSSVGVGSTFTLSLPCANNTSE